MRLYQKQSVWRLLNPLTICGSFITHRRLLWQFTRRSIELQHKGSFLGIAWTVLNPLLLFAVYAFVFIAVFNSRFGTVESETRVDYAIGLFLGLCLLQMFQESMMVAPSLVVQNPNFVKKVVFPLEVLPAAAVGAAAFRCIVGLALVLASVEIWGPGLSGSVLWLFPILIALGLLSVGVALMLSAVGVFLRDIAPFVQFLSVLLMFVSAVFYSFSSIPPAFSFLRFNPLLIVVETSRHVVLWHQAPIAADVLYLFLCGVITFVLGQAAFSGLKPAFADVL
ncbi:hypothetical protein DB347_11360 [Opitutaceae bacterium EW11]|nr:hypothetical protein DB347_11360 [Opitutaceae bacterium EW11]